MTIQPKNDADFGNTAMSGGPLPEPVDTETTMMLRSFLVPIVEAADSWSQLRTSLAEKGYDITFRQGRFVLIDSFTGKAICTGQTLGVPLRSLAGRLGRPNITLRPEGHAELRA